MLVERAESMTVVRQTRSEYADDCVYIYLHEIGNVPLLNAQEECALAKAIQEGLASTQRLEAHSTPPTAQERRTLELKAARGRLAQRRLIEANLRLVVSVARRYARSGISLLDLIQEGNIGLLRAVEKFDYRLGNRFSTYATSWIRQAISRAVVGQRHMVRVPEYMIRHMGHVLQVKQRLEQELGREPSSEEVAVAAGLISDRDRRALEEAHSEGYTLPADVQDRLHEAGRKIDEILLTTREPISFEVPMNADGDTTLLDFIPDDPLTGPAEQISRRVMAQQLSELLNTLSQRERVVLSLRLGLGDGESRTLSEVGQMFGVTRERVRQIERDAMRKLRCQARVRNLAAQLA